MVLSCREVCHHNTSSAEVVYITVANQVHYSAGHNHCITRRMLDHHGDGRELYFHALQTGGGSS